MAELVTFLLTPTRIVPSHATREGAGVNTTKTRAHICVRRPITLEMSLYLGRSDARQYE